MKVFISSTYSDLMRHRIAAADALERLGLQLARMETFGARPSEPMAACFEEIAESEIFVGVYAHRYGHVPEASAISITESEFDHATALRRPTFCYLHADEFPWPGMWDEPADARNKLQAFKARLNSMVARDTFTTPDSLALRVASSVGRYLLADPRKHGSSQIAAVARLTLTDAAAALFVDLMRLVSVAAETGAPGANAKRYAEFLAIARQHFGECESQATRLVWDKEFDLFSKWDTVRRILGWALVRLESGPRLDPGWTEFEPHLRRGSDALHQLATTAAGEYYSERRDQLMHLIQHETAGWSSPLKTVSSLMQARYDIQTRILKHLRTHGLEISTVRDDIELKLAIPYFLVDYALLHISN